MTWRPSAEMATLVTDEECFSKARASFPVATSLSARPLYSPVRAYRPLGVKAKQFTLASLVQISFPEDRFHRLSVPSALADSARWPSNRKLTAITQLVCPVN